MADKLLQKYIECLKRSKSGYSPPPVYRKKYDYRRLPPQVVKFPYVKKRCGKQELARTTTLESLGRIKPTFMELLIELERAILCHRPDSIKEFCADYLECKLLRRALLEVEHDDDEEEEEDDKFETCEVDELDLKNLQEVAAPPCVECSYDPRKVPMSKSKSKSKSKSRSKSILITKASQKISGDQKQVEEEEADILSLRPVESWWKEELGKPQPLLAEWLGFAKSGSQSIDEKCHRDEPAGKHSDIKSKHEDESIIDPAPIGSDLPGYAPDYAPEGKYSDIESRHDAESIADPAPIGSDLPGYEPFDQRSDIESPYLGESVADTAPKYNYETGYDEGDRKSDEDMLGYDYDEVEVGSKRSTPDAAIKVES